MSERPTPETDALERCQRIQRLQPARDPRFWHGDRLDQMRALARKLERERDEAQTTLTNIHRWIQRNHTDGFIDSLTYVKNLERIADRWYDRYDIIECDRDGLKTQNAKLQAELDKLKESIK